jgi:hypothetical protein
MARLQRAFFTPGAAAANQGPGTSCRLTSCRLTSCRRPLKAAFFGIIFLGFFGFFLTFFLLFLRLRP